MTQALKGTANSEVKWVFSSTGGLSTPTDNASVRSLCSLTSGVGDNQANQMYAARRLVGPATGTDLLDLSGSLLNQFGQTIMFSSVKAMLIHNVGEPDYAATPGWTEIAGQDIIIGGAATNPWTAPFNGDPDAVIVIPSGGQVLLTAPLGGFTVVAGSSDVLQVEWDGNIASGGAIEYEIVIFGVE